MAETPKTRSTRKEPAPAWVDGQQIIDVVEDSVDEHWEQREVTDVALSPLPAAEHQAPACGACGAETNCYEPYEYQCDDCVLTFSGSDLTPAYVVEDEKPCAKPCANSWHEPDKIKNGYRFDCFPCALPSSHTSMCWTGCTMREADRDR
ncbi:hypothetical protein [Kineococcus terrestris]|uniref:hypothetical protein n=1 Tax=Kineococcus terrestris TaxID=2044856 RepID=UPI0034DB18EF